MNYNDGETAVALRFCSCVEVQNHRESRAAALFLLQELSEELAALSPLIERKNGCALSPDVFLGPALFILLDWAAAFHPSRLGPSFLLGRLLVSFGEEAVSFC
ncbi:hypothetical protein Drorol1_Dr00000087 [Drosera rotundifolia]